jgi:hypothetical protein
MIGGRGGGIDSGNLLERNGLGSVPPSFYLRSKR